jgi:4-diphosphocytidyl-2-C-methyl-D-erythritol kinase
MPVQRFATDVVVWAPAKVNLFLEVLAKRADGYHEIATLLVAVRLFDKLVFAESPQGELRLHCNRPDLSTGPDNLVIRAAGLLQRHTGCRRGAAIRLVKRIPLAAGLAGGSTDAAATLAGLNQLWGLGLAIPELAELGAKLGSDVPFFFAGPAAWCTGRGEKVESVGLGKPLFFVLVCPPRGLSTAEVYRNIAVPDAPETGETIRRALAGGDVQEVGRLLHNRLQPAAEKLYPAVAAWQARLEQLKPAGVRMSGSGSSLFALCRNRAEARRIAQVLRHGSEERPRIYLVRSCSTSTSLPQEDVGSVPQD